MFNNSHLLSWIIFTPLLMGIVMLFFPKSLERFYRSWALIASLINVAFSITLWRGFEGASAEMQFVEQYSWLPDLGVFYALGVDGISLPLVLLTALITPLALLGTWPSSENPLKKEKFFVLMVLMLQSGMYGTFLASDLFLFYFFWEVVLIPMFFLIGIWGGADRVYATIKFFLYTMVGSLLMLVAIFYLIQYHAVRSGVPSALLSNFNFGGFAFDSTTLWSALTSEQGLLFLAFTLAFVIKVPMVPFHTWLPDAHVQAPTLGSVFLAAVLLKMGTYGLLRISLPFFPQAAVYFAPYFYALGVFGIIYGALCAMVQKDFKKLVAYSSVSHMGYIIIGLFSFDTVAMSGALYQMVNHGVSAAGLFLIVGFLYERLHTRQLDDFGQLAKTVPWMAIGFMVVTLSSVALPGTNGFVGEYTILIGTFQVAPTVAFLAGTGVILGAVYALKAYQLVMLGPVSNKSIDRSHLHDLNGREILAMAGLAIFIFGIGLFPDFFFGKSRMALEAYTKALQTVLP